MGFHGMREDKRNATLEYLKIYFRIGGYLVRSRRSDYLKPIFLSSEPTNLVLGHQV